jgi:hypothetical protein
VHLLDATPGDCQRLPTCEDSAERKDVSVDPGSAQVYADRMAEAVKAIALRDRELVRTTLAGLKSRFQPLDGGVQLRSLARLGDQDFFWDVVDQPLADRLNGLVSGAVPVGADDAMPGELVSVLALVRDERARNRLPGLEEHFNTLSFRRRMDVAAVRPDLYFVPTVIWCVTEAPGFRAAEEVGQLLVLPHGPFFTTEELRAVLTAWCDNRQCRQAGDMRELAVGLFAATAHLGSDHYAIWEEFLTRVRAIEPEDSYYRYEAVETALNTERSSNGPS